MTDRIVHRLGIETLELEKIDKIVAVDSIRYQLSKGLFYIDIWDETAELTREALSSFPRESYKLVARINLGKSISNQINNYLEIIGVPFLDYIHIFSDNSEITKKQIAEIKQILNSGQAINMGVFTDDSKFMNNLVKIFDLDICESRYKFLNRDTNIDEIINKGEENGIIFFAHHLFSSSSMAPVLEQPLIHQLSQKYNKTPTQIVLNWFLDRESTAVWIKSTNKSHIDENLQALDFGLSTEEVSSLNILFGKSTSGIIG